MLFYSPMRRRTVGSAGILLLVAGLVAGCTVEPLNSSRPISSSTSSPLEGSTRDILASTTVSSQSSREGQQVRNKLLFAMNGGRLQPGGKYRIDLEVTSRIVQLLVGRDSLAPTAAQAILSAQFQLVDISSGKEVYAGRRRSLASFDRTTQSFANERAERDAQNRAASDLAQQIRLSVAQKVAEL